MTTQIELRSKPIVFWNAASGRFQEIGELRDAVSTDQPNWVELSHELDLVEEIEKGISEGCQTVVAAGGDGTVNALVNALMSIDENTRPALAIIPLGTANDFAGTLGIPDAVGAAFELIKSTVPVSVDVVHISGENVDRYYANIAAGGNCARVSEALTDETKERWGAFSYLRGAVDILPDMKTYRVTAKCDDEEFVDIASWAILVANGKTNAGHINVAPAASPTDGLIDVVIIRDGDVGDMIQIVANNLAGNFLESEQVIFRQVRSLSLTSEPTMRFTLDGEVVDRVPVNFRVVKSAIKMHVGTQVFAS